MLQPLPPRMFPMAISRLSLTVEIIVAHQFQADVPTATTRQSDHRIRNPEGLRDPDRAVDQQIGNPYHHDDTGHQEPHVHRYGPPRPLRCGVCPPRVRFALFTAWDSRRF